MLTRHNYLWYLQEVTRRAKQKLKKKETQKRETKEKSSKL